MPVTGLEICMGLGRRRKLRGRGHILTTFSTLFFLFLLYHSLCCLWSLWNWGDEQVSTKEKAAKLSLNNDIADVPDIGSFFQGQLLWDSQVHLPPQPTQNLLRTFHCDAHGSGPWPHCYLRITLPHYYGPLHVDSFWHWRILGIQGPLYLTRSRTSSPFSMEAVQPTLGAGFLLCSAIPDDISQTLVFDFFHGKIRQISTLSKEWRSNYLNTYLSNTKFALITRQLEVPEWFCNTEH